jgi:hypothetical protein
MNRYDPPPPLLPARNLSAALTRAQTSKDRAVAVMVTAAHCPWCRLVIEEQLIPRVRSKAEPRLDIVVFDLADSQAVPLASGMQPAERPANSKTPPISPAAWAEMHGYRVAPTVVMVGAGARPLFAPLVGYSSRDFYGAYLDDQIVRAHRYWTQQA